MRHGLQRMRERLVREEISLSNLFGPEVGRHARSAVGVAGLPFNMAVEIEAEVLIKG